MLNAAFSKKHAFNAKKGNTTTYVQPKNRKGTSNRWLRVKCDRCEFIYDNDAPKIGNNNAYDLKIAYNCLKGDISQKS